MTIIFCPNCETYLPPGVITCPTCGQARPVDASVQVVWAGMVEANPVGSPVEVGEEVVMAVHDSGAMPQQASLHWFSLVDGQRLRMVGQLERGRLVSGLRRVRFSKPGRAGETAEVSETSAVLVSTYSAEPIAQQGMVAILDKGGEEQWRWEPGVQAVSAPVAAEGRVWVTTNTGLLAGLNLADGREEGRFSLGVTPSLAAPALDEERIYIPCRGPSLIAVGLDGRLAWRFNLAKGWLDRTPTLEGDRLYAVTNLAGMVVALERATGHTVWQEELGSKRGKRLSPPVADGERLYVGAEDGLYALALDSGKQVWHFPTSRRIEAAPVVVAGTVYVAGHDHRLYALEASSGRELWRYEVERRIEVAPLITQAPYPLVLVADQGGKVTAIERPLGPAAYEAAGQWLKAAEGYLEAGQVEQTAGLLQAHGEPFKAAQLWQVMGYLEKAAHQYQVAGRWLQAAEIWQALDQPDRRAKALQQQAQSLTSQGVDNEARALAWEAAVEAWRDLGEEEAAEECQAEVARYRRLPHLEVKIEPGDLKLNRWATLHFIIKNAGYATAKFLIIRARGGNFEGEVAETRRIMSLKAGVRKRDYLDVLPLAAGNVPLRVTIEYQDEQGREYTWFRKMYLPVS